MLKKLCFFLFILITINVIGCDSQTPRPKKKAVQISEEVKKALQGTGSIYGVIRFEGDKPELSKIQMDKECKKKHSSTPMDEKLVIGDGNGFANVFLHIKSGLPNGPYPIPESPVVLDQNGCIYTPHVFAIMAGQRLQVLNSDGIMHNVHILTKNNPEENLGMPGDTKETTMIFIQEEAMFMVKCDVHPWMICYASVMSHPYYAVSGKDGKFEIAKLQAGTYEVEVWHEMGEQLQLQPGKLFKVTLQDGEKKEQNLVVSLKK
jgi:plastocyanin